MVTIINYKKRQKDNQDFFILEISGGIEMIQSKTTGKFYATAKKAYLPSTFDEPTCQALIGTQIQGKIEKVECEPYSYTIKDTEEIILLSHSYEYVPENNSAISPNQSTTQNHSSYVQRELAENHSFQTNEELVV
ncbi:hypothetical protein [Apibacter muscae]|uniref:hypothetical protein n=1 Tax=Apibacter muscae TaxID=2509004 RepID=UPI001629A440|nr:hypothetical protein [Apibacter muscae]